MSVIKLNKVKKYYGDRLILDIDNLEINEGTKVAIIGENGAGKTTLLKIIIGETDIDSGFIDFNYDYSYITQGTTSNGSCEEGKIKSLLKTPREYEDFLSGGEKVKINITKALNSNKKLLIADEPTSNLDINSIEVTKNLLSSYKGTLLLVSHDRDFLQSLCDNILEIDHGKVRLYKCNYNEYLILKEAEKTFDKKEYSQYIKEKNELEKAILKKENLKDSIRKTPRRMGNSEARLHKMGDQRGKKNIDGNIKALKSRMNHLEIKEKPIENKEIIIKISKTAEIHSKTIMELRNFNLFINSKKLLTAVNFKVKKGEKVALLGENGSGKSTLLKELLKNNSEEIRLSKFISIGYFDQQQDILNEEKSILENIKTNCSFDESFIRINLDNFGFSSNDIYKKIKVLSGGEKVKVALCKIILGDNNTLVLDEPTNYLDITAISALEKALMNTEKTLIIVSHDISFISTICNKILEIKDKKVTSFSGTYKDFINEKINLKEKSKLNKETIKIKEELLLLENSLVKVISQLSIEKNEDKLIELDLEYKNLLKKIKELRLLNK
ncbi:MAG: ABC-F type ribosomal protection protein CplR [Clostridium sp.]|uniref:ABC-F type ribosomal protection protein CplR n=1 Tax=Clostridium sp. TaxID=1506 RepID=UPI003EE5D0BF